MSTNLLGWPGRVCALDDHPRALCVEESVAYEPDFRKSKREDFFR